MDRCAALQEFRKRLGLPPSSTDPSPLEPHPVEAAPAEKLTVVDEAAAALIPHVVTGCNLPVFRDMPCPFTDRGDATLCRFLRARNYDVDKAEKMYRACVEVRERWRLDTVLEEEDPLEEMWQASVPVSHCGYDKKGRPIIIERSGEVRVGKLMKFLTKTDFFYRHLRHMEVVERHVTRAQHAFGPHVSQVVIVMDLAGLSLRPDSHAIPLFKQMVHIDTNYYPELLGAFFIINAPWIFKPLWAMIRPWLDARTQQKFHVLGSNYASTLLEYIDADQLPREFGGSLDVTIPTYRHLGEDYQAPTARVARQQEAMKGGVTAEEE